MNEELFNISRTEDGGFVIQQGVYAYYQRGDMMPATATPLDDHEKIIIMLAEHIWKQRVR